MRKRSWGERKREKEQERGSERDRRERGGERGEGREKERERGAFADSHRYRWGSQTEKENDSHRESDKEQFHISIFHMKLLTSTR